jgi:hypothetical protein
MPAYQTSPFSQRVALIPGQPAYSWGKAPTANARMSISAVAITSNVATLTVQMLEGVIPAVGALLTVQGTQTVTSGGGSNFNLTNVALTGVTINSSTGAGTLTFALTSTNISTTTDSGKAIAVALPTYEAIGSAAAGQQFAVSSGSGAQNDQSGIVWWTQFTGSPSTVAMNLQGANVDQDAYYTTVDSSTNASGESRSVGTINYSFYRIQAASTGGTSPTVLAGIELR